MEKTRNRPLYKVLSNALAVAVTVICAMALPQLFHAFGVLTGLGDKVGQMFLPMYLPVLILAFKTNAITGVLAGILSPVISFSISGMPTAAMLPFIVVELACFGLLAGLLSQKKMNIYAKIFIVQLSSKLVRIAATFILGYFFTTATITATAVLHTVVLALPGYIIQLLIVPYFTNNERISK